MNYMEFASDLPLHQTIKFTSVEELEETMQRLDVSQEMKQIGTGKFQSDLAVRTTPQAELYADRFSKAVSMHLEAPKDTVGILLPRSASGRFIVCGENAANEKIVVIPYGSGVDITIPDLAGSDAMTIPIDRFNTMTEVLAPTYVRSEKYTMTEGNQAQLNHLQKAIIDLVTNPDMEVNDEQLSNLLAATIASITDCPSNNTQQSGEKHTNRAQIQIIKLVQEYIEVHYNEAICMEDLCRMTGVGLRSLQRYFKGYFDLSIAEYIKSTRLNNANRELKKAHPSECTVTQIAMQNGFSHLGRFSIEFHNRFGQSPRHTLAMQAGHKT